MKTILALILVLVCVVAVGDLVYAGIVKVRPTKKSTGWIFRI